MKPPTSPRAEVTARPRLACSRGTGLPIAGRLPGVTPTGALA